MVPPRIETKELVVHHMGEPGERMPISGLGGCKGPNYGLAGESRLHVGIVGDVDIIVIVDKLMVFHLPVNTKDKYNQNQTYKGFPPHGARTLLIIYISIKFPTLLWMNIKKFRINQSIHATY